jgi:hypothetical protein
MRQSWRFAGVSAVYELDEEPQDGDGARKFMKSWWARQIRVADDPTGWQLSRQLEDRRA